MRFLVTRPQAEGEATAQKLLALGHEAILSPLLQIEWVSFPLPDGESLDGVLFTSVNGVRAAVRHPEFPILTRHPAWVVGERTAAEAAHAGFYPIHSAEGAVAELIALVARQHVGSTITLLYVAGAEQSINLAGALAPFGVKVQAVVGYRARCVPTLVTEAASGLEKGTIHGVLHYSRRTAGGFVAAAPKSAWEGCSVAHYCLSEPIAVVLRVAGAKRVQVADRPTEARLFALFSSAKE